MSISSAAASHKPLQKSNGPNTLEWEKLMMSQAFQSSDFPVTVGSSLPNPRASHGCRAPCSELIGRRVVPSAALYSMSVTVAMMPLVTLTSLRCSSRAPIRYKPVPFRIVLRKRRILLPECSCVVVPRFVDGRILYCQGTCGVIGRGRVPTRGVAPRWARQTIISSA